MSNVFRAIADPMRRAILDELARREEQTLFELCTRLATRLGAESSRQAVSHHLHVLEAAKLVVVRREGRYKYLSLNRTPLEKTVGRWLRTRHSGGHAMKIVASSVFVDDQLKALQFYTTVLGFEKKRQIPLGEHYWLTVVSPSATDGTELVLEPDGHPAVKPFKAALVEDGIPWTSFGVDDVRKEHGRLVSLGVRFTQPPVEHPAVISAVFDDTCGNLIQIAQRKGAA